MTHARGNRRVAGADDVAVSPSPIPPCHAAGASCASPPSLLSLFAAHPLALSAQQHPVYPVLAPWSGAVLESAEITYRGTKASMVGRQPRLVATSRSNLLLREDVTFDRDLPNLLPTEGELVIGLNAYSQTKVLVTIRSAGHKLLREPRSAVGEPGRRP